MKVFKSFLFFFVTMSLISSGCEDKANKNKGNNDKGPYTSKESIFELLKKDYPDLEENDVCIVESESFKSLFVVGYFAYDRGCAAEKMFFNGNEIDANHGDAKVVLVTNDFKKNPEDVITNYHLNVINIYKSTLQSENEDFKEAGVSFSTVSTIKSEGTYISQAWVQRPSGMNPENSYYLSKITFDTEGNFISAEKTKQFSVSIFKNNEIGE